jgi:hypothetical protein
MPETFGIKYELRAGGDVRYDPQRADPGSGFGPHEVHPQRIAVVRDGCTQLEHNGDWIVLFQEGSELRYLAISEARGGRVTAEKLAAFRNDGLPTRVVDLAGKTSTSTHTSASVLAEIESARITPMAAGP